MVKITLEFPSVDAAIVGLGKLVGAQAKVVTEAGRLPADAPTARGRKPRADKGQPREPYGQRVSAHGPNSATNQTEQPATGAASGVAPSNSVPATTGAGKTAEEAANPTPTTAATAAAPVLTHDDAQKALEKVFTQKGMPAAQELLGKFNVKRLRDLKPEQYDEFVRLGAAALLPGTSV